MRRLFRAPAARPRALFLSRAPPRSSHIQYESCVALRAAVGARRIQHDSRVAPGAAAGAPFSSSLYEAFHLQSFSDTELKNAFDSVDVNGDGVLERHEIRTFLAQNGLENRLTEFMYRFDMDEDGVISKEDFNEVLIKMANRVDKRVWPVAASMLLTGGAIGVIVPVMPLLVKSMGITTAQFGIVISAFAFSKMIGNVPASVLADRVGRKPVMTLGMGLIALSVGGVSFATCMQDLVSLRLTTGLGVACFTTASTLYLVDISTPFNRTQTMAPISAAFSAGAALGPAVGGVLVDSVGMRNCFLIVGGAFAALTMINASSFWIKETLTSDILKKTTSSVSIYEQWKDLLRNRRLFSMLLMNGAFWVALSGSQMTLLPMLLVGDDYGLNASQIGMIFAGMSAVNFIGAQPAAYVADKYGKPGVIAGAAATLSAAMALLPFTSTAGEAVAVLMLWSMGSTFIGSAPTAYVTDIVATKDRSQALALMRTTGDVGLLLGASTTGYVADSTSYRTAMLGDAGLLFVASGGFAYAARAAANAAAKVAAKEKEKERVT